MPVFAKKKDMWRVVWRWSALRTNLPFAIQSEETSPAQTGHSEPVGCCTAAFRKAVVYVSCSNSASGMTAVRTKLPDASAAKFATTPLSTQCYALASRIGSAFKAAGPDRDGVKPGIQTAYVHFETN